MTVYGPDVTEALETYASQFDDGLTATCERYAVLSVDGERYCETHAMYAPTSDR